MSQNSIIDPRQIPLLDEFIARAGVITLTAHTFPDGDAAGSVSALCSYLRESRGKDAVIVLPNPCPETLDFIFAGLPLLLYSQSPELSLARIRESDLLISLDYNAFRRTEGLCEALSGSTATKVLIDHHLEPDNEAFNLVFSRPDISSASEMLFWILMALPDVGDDPRKLPSAAARALLAGMTTDTNNFANSVYPSTFRMASALLGAGVDRDDILDRLYNSARENRVRLIGYLLGEKMTLACDGAVSVMILDEAARRRFDIREGESEGIVNMPLAIRSVRMSVFLKQYDEEGNFHVSIRSKRGVSAARFAREYFHGGGHEMAAGGRLYYPADVAAPEDALQFVLNALKKPLP